MEYPAFIEDQDYMDMDSSVPETDQLRAMLSNLTRIHLLSANKFDSFDDLIREYLISGIEVFGLETGIVSQVTNEGIYRVCDVVSPLEILHKGQEFPIEDTYCREVVRSNKVLGFPEVGKLDYMNCHPVYQNLKLEAYLSSPIFVGDTLFGTFNFTSIEPRARGFSKHERNLILLMANSIGSFILLRNKEDKLVELNERIKRFVGYVAHDLRNPLGSIIGFAKMGVMPKTSEARRLDIFARIEKTGEQALEFVSSILENAALSAGKISVELEVVEVKAMFDEAIASVELYANTSGTKLLVQIEESACVRCDMSRLNQSLMNLLINAIKYSPVNGTVMLRAQREEDACRIDVINKMEVKPKPMTGENLKLYGSVGFGLDIVAQVLEAHGSELEVSETQETYVATFRLPLAVSM